MLMNYHTTQHISATTLIYGKNEDKKFLERAPKKIHELQDVFL